MNIDVARDEIDRYVFGIWTIVVVREWDRRRFFCIAKRGRFTRMGFYWKPAKATVTKPCQHRRTAEREVKADIARREMKGARHVHTV